MRSIKVWRCIEMQDDLIHPTSSKNATTTKSRIPWKIIRAFTLTLIAGTVLAITYNSCIVCVLGVLIFSTLTINCLPGMPLVFFATIAILLYNAIDFQRASVRVEVPLQDIVHVPTWKDMQQYVRLETNANQQRRRRLMASKLNF